MDHPSRQDLADTVGADVGRPALLREIVAKVAAPDAAAPDDDLDLWWGTVEIDRLASGLTLAAIATLSEPDAQDDPAAAWVETSDATGDEPTHLTPAGRAAVRRIVAGG